MRIRIIILLLAIGFAAHGQIRLSDLTVKGSISGSEKIPVSGAGTPAITPDLLKSYLLKNVPIATGADTKVAALVQAPTAYTAGDWYIIRNQTVNTGAVTINFNSLGATSVVKNGSTALEAGDMAAGGVYILVYDGTNFVIEGISGGGSGSSEWDDITGTPTTLSGYGITDAVPTSRTVNGHALSGNVTVTASDVGLGNVDNTSDVNKPVSTAQQTALDGKQGLDSDLTTIAGLSASDDDFLQRKSGAWSNRTLAQVRTDLALVAASITNGVTSSAPNQDQVFDALALKSNLASPTFTGTPAAPTASNGTNTTQIATTAFVMASSPKEYGVALSNPVDELTAGTGKAYFRMPRAMTVTAVRASLKTAQSSGTIVTVDINENGSSILSTKLTIDNSEKTSMTAATPAVISDTSLADDAEITFDIDGAGTGGVQLIVWLIGY